MNNIKHFIGLDASAASFTSSVFDPLSKAASPALSWENTGDGYSQLNRWLRENGCLPSETVICLENTGVYSETLCYWLFAKGYTVAVEPPQKIKQAFHDVPRKTDELDSQQISEYAFRYLDKLHIWKPVDAVVEQITVLLATREQYTDQGTAVQNALKQIRLKVVRTPLAEESLSQTILYLKGQIKKIDKAIEKLVTSHPTIGPMAALITSIPGVGILLASNLISLTKGFTTTTNPRQIASHLGICPNKHLSGTSVYKKDRSRGYGHERSRKLLYLAAMSLRTHRKEFKNYFLRKCQQGKSKRLVLNNIENKLLKIICAVVESQTPFIENYKSVSPMLLCA